MNENENDEVVVTDLGKAILERRKHDPSYGLTGA